MIALPFTTGLDSFTEIVDLDGQSWILRFDWNNRAEAWYLTISTIEEVEVVGGIKIVLGMELLKATGRENIPPGALYANAITPVDRVGKNDIPAAVELIYIPEAEL